MVVNNQVQSTRQRKIRKFKLRPRTINFTQTCQKINLIYKINENYIYYFTNPYIDSIKMNKKFQMNKTQGKREEKMKDISSIKII